MSPRPPCQTDNNLLNLLEYIFPFHLLFCGSCTLALRSREMSGSKIFYIICTGHTEILLTKLEKGVRWNGPPKNFENQNLGNTIPCHLSNEFFATVLVTLRPWICGEKWLAISPLPFPDRL